MSFTSIAALAEATPDPTKHVNYHVGMVLGVDDFTQDHSYGAARDKWLAAAALGTGVLSGLAVTVSGRGKAQAGVVRVSEGTAVSPSGQLISVPSAQCADVDEWIAANADQIDQQLGSPPESPPGDVTLYVLLSYSEQETDPVPIPADPTLANDDLTAASRVQDSFLLELAAKPPPPDTSQFDVHFVAWMKELHYDPAGGSTVADLLAALHRAAAPPSPPVWPPPAWRPPPATLVIPRRNATEFLRAALVAWVTQLRPALVTSATGSPDSTPSARDGSDAVLVAALSVPVSETDSGPRAAGTATVAEEGQPIVLGRPLLQELSLRSLVPRASAPQGVGVPVAAGRFMVVRKGEGRRAETEIETLFSQNLDATPVPRPGTTPRRDKESTAVSERPEREEGGAHEQYIRLRLEHGHEVHHRYVITALPLVEAHSARYTIEEISDPSHQGVGSHSGPFMVRLAPVELAARTHRVGFSVQITDLGPAHPRRQT